MKIAISLGALLFIATLCTTAARSQNQTSPSAPGVNSPFIEPYNAWEYRAVDTLQKAGILIGDPDGIRNGPPRLTRYEFAIAIARLGPLFEPNLAYKGRLRALAIEMRNRLNTDRPAQMALRSLVLEFTPELKQIGRDSPEAKAQIDAVISHFQSPASLTAPFPDVPKDHWAYHAVETLKKDGIVVGYPGGAY